MRLPPIGLGAANILGAELPVLIDAAQKHGFRRITVNPGSFAAALDAGWTENALEQRLAEADLEVTMIDAVKVRLPGLRPRSSLDPQVAAKLPPVVLNPPDEAVGLRCAYVLHCSVVNVTHFMGAAVAWEELAAAMSAFCRRAAAHDLKVCIEFMPDSGIPDLWTADAIVEMCGESNVGILLDVFHLDRSGGGVSDVRRLRPGRILGVQLSDRVPPPPGTPYVPLRGRLLPGEGELPLTDLVVAALENNAEATIDVEVLNEELAALDADEVARILAEATRAWMIGVDQPLDS
jgi:sugar phosphate isomerase/epimerase